MLPTSRSFWFVVALCAASSLCGTRVQAQRAYDLSRFSPALDGDGFISVQGTRTPGADRVTLGLFADYASGLLRARTDTGRDVDLVEDRVASMLSIEGGLGGRVALALSLPVVLYQRGDRLNASESDLPAFAFGDPWLHARYRFVGDPSGGVDQRRDGPGVALQLGAGLPVGQLDAYAAEPTVRVEAQLLGDMHLLGAGIGGSLGIRHRFEGRNVYGQRVRDEFTFGAGLELPIPPLFPLSGLLELRGATDFRLGVTTSLEAELGARLRFADGVVLTLAGGLGLTDGMGTPGGRVIAGVWFTPTDSDADHDGVPDARDACPPLPEDVDGFQDTDGCPDPDNDNDLVPDVDDLCPNQEALEGQDDDEDGCTDK